MTCYGTKEEERNESWDILKVIVNYGVDRIFEIGVKFYDEENAELSEMASLLSFKTFNIFYSSLSYHSHLILPSLNSSKLRFSLSQAHLVVSVSDLAYLALPRGGMRYTSIPIPIPVISFLVNSWPALSCPFLFCPVLSCLVLSYFILFGPVVSCSVVVCPVVSCFILLRSVLICLVLFCLILFCFVLSCPII